MCFSKCALPQIDRKNVSKLLENKFEHAENLNF